LVFLVALFFASILENITPYFYKLFIETITKNNFNDVLKILVLLFITMEAANLIGALSFWLGDKVLIPAAVDARAAVFRRVQELDFAFHANKNTGSLISAFKRGDGAFFELYHNLHHNILSILINLGLVIFFFNQITFAIIFIILLIFLINSIVGWFLIKTNIKRRAEFNEAEDRVSGIITDNFLNYETVKFFAKEKREEERLIAELREWTIRLWRYANSFRFMDVATGSISNIGVFLVLAVVLQKTIKNEAGVGDLVMVAGFTTSFFNRFIQLIYQIRNIAKHYTDIERYFSILDNEVLIKDPLRPRHLKRLRGEISFKDVSFRYPDSKENVLEKINLDIPAGKSVAFVGRSGAGKTTIIKLLLRFYDVSEGAVLLDGVDIREFAKSQLRSFIGIVPQEPILFNNTIGYNIAYGRDGATEEEIIKAAKMANLHDFIANLPDKYETQVGERGIKLSGGQKQRLAIARMILSNPKIIVFDEATSNLDSESERLIQDALQNISKGRTVLIIAHRFSTVRRVDRIVVIEQGKIVEDGTHDSLVKKKNGIYSYLWRLQTKQGELSTLNLLG